MDENIIPVPGFTRRDTQSQVELLMENLHRYLE
jgi:hypothetical protein